MGEGEDVVEREQSVEYHHVDFAAVLPRLAGGSFCRLVFATSYWLLDYRPEHHVTPDVSPVPGGWSVVGNQPGDRRRYVFDNAEPATTPSSDGRSDRGSNCKLFAAVQQLPETPSHVCELWWGFMFICRFSAGF